MRLEIRIDADTKAATTHLIGELERWLQLGLLSEAETIRIGQKLSSRLPLVYKTPADKTPADVPSKVLADVDPGAGAGLIPSLQSQVSVKTSPREPFFSKFGSRLVQSFLAEVSVLWLLFLGVFLVVVSSGVLAASQWQSFSRVGQYAILLLYTLAFGGASRWAASQDTLKTTAQMLKVATLLLIPLNMWMMDALAIPKTALGVAVLASVGLSYLTMVLMPQRRAGFNLLGLSWLHWGWGGWFWPVVATYLGTVGSAVNLGGMVPQGSAEGSELANGETDGPALGGLIAIALLILLIRSLWIAQVPMSQLGLALGLWGWMVCRLQRQYPLWPQLGAGLLLLGWLVTVVPQPLQAIAVSGLAGWLLIERLQRQTQESTQLRTLAILWFVGFQACVLVWLSLPIDLRQILLSTVEGVSLGPISAFGFAGVWLYGYIGWMLLKAKQFRLKGQVAWGALTERLAIGLGGVLVSCALTAFPSLLLMASLSGLSLTVATISRLRRPATKSLIYANHVAAIVALLSGIYAFGEWFGGWTAPLWAIIFLGLVAVEWLASVAMHRYLEWRQSAWYVGIALSVIAYRLLQESWGSEVGLVWLVVPVLSTWLVYRRRLLYPQQATVLTILALGGQVLLFTSWQMATMGFGVGAGLLFFHSCRWRSQKYLPILTVGFAVGGAHTAAMWLWLTRQAWPDNMAQLWVLTALMASTLWGLARQLSRQVSPLFQGYTLASRGWSRALSLGLGLGLMLLTAWIYSVEGNHLFTESLRFWPDPEIPLRYGTVATILLLARFLGQRRLTNWDYWEIAYGVGLLVAMGLPLWQQDTNPQLLGTGLVVLGGLTQLIGTIYGSRQQQAYQTSWHAIPLVYGALGMVLGHTSFTATTGFYTVVMGGVTLGISQRQENLRPLSYGGLGLLSLGVYEWVLYPMLQTSGGAVGDGLTVLAWVAGAIAILYLFCQRWIQRFSNLTVADIRGVSTLHWLLSVVLVLLAMIRGQSRSGVWLWLGVTGLLALYACLRGNYCWFPAHGHVSERDHHTDEPIYKKWTWSGLTIATVAIPYGAIQLFSSLIFMRTWGSLLVCGVSLLVYRLPWQRWGWPLRPWQRMTLSWPILVIILSVATVNIQSVLLVGAFYAAMAKQLRTIRLSYLSLGLFNWALLRYLIVQDGLTPLWLAILVGLSILFILAVDPHWQLVSARQERHYLRSFATLLIGITGIYQAEIASPVFIGLSLLISFGVIGFGLTTQVRAYLYMGTLTFVLQILRTIMMFVSTDGRLLWAIGIMLGITLMWVAATFEARRTQIMGLFSQWSETLRNWD